MPESARQLLSSLAGQDIETVTGRTNRILALEGDQVRVSTSRSPSGQLVPVAWVQAALDQLVETGAVEISVASVGYRSAFIGAVLSQMPGAEVDRSKSPPWIRLRSSR
jgi:hypothetical protein